MDENFQIVDDQKIVPIIDLHTCIQGEGAFMGIPHFLVRFSGCNMNCQFSDWICDTAYASWKPETGKYALKDVLDLVAKHPRIRHAFITGGEPTFNIPLLRAVAKLLRSCGIFISIETNGTNFLPLDIPIDYISMSPKLSNSIPIPGTPLNDGIVNRVVTEADREKHEKSRTNYANMQHMIDHFDYQLKFVVTAEAQLQEVQDMAVMLGVPRHKIWLMPEGVTAAQLQKRRGWIIETAIEHGYNYSDRLHIVAYDNKREA
jgi:7-carboxy-7-deazaguanine synthase